MLAGSADRVLQKHRARVSSSLVDVAIGVLRSPPALLTSRWTAAAHPQQQHRRTPQPRRCHSQRSGRPVWVVAAGAASGSVTSSAVEPDYVLQLPGSSVAINVFGVEHLERQPHIGEWVLRNRPAAVVVETACHPGHGAWPGNLFSCADQVVLGAGGGFFQRVFCQVAAAMQEQGDAALAPGGVWQQACENFNGEQLAYVAALATGAKLAFGDRPKEITYRRLYALPSPQQIDEAFAHEVRRQYLEVLGEPAPSESSASSATSDVVDQIMMVEREVVMCKVAADLAAAEGGAVALVVGSAHLPGIQSLWQSGTWRQLLAADDLAASPLMAAPELGPSDMAAPGSGAKRGMLDAVMSLSVTQEVLQDLDSHLPPVPEDQDEERQLAFEFFSAQRTQLAALPREMLDRVCGCVRGCESGESMWNVLAPVRAVRPVNGGNGWDEEVVVALRGLDMYLSVGGGEEGEDANNAAALEA